jgi:hypothetical protein
MYGRVGGVGIGGRKESVLTELDGSTVVMYGKDSDESFDTVDKFIVEMRKDRS